MTAARVGVRVSTPEELFSHVVTREDGAEYRVTGATYLGPRESCTNGPLWEVHAERLEDGAGAYWHTSAAPVIGIRSGDGIACGPSCYRIGCYGHPVDALEVTR